jgi:cytochrome c oxidase subunit 2
VPNALLFWIIPWMPKDGAMHGPALDHLLGVNLIILFALFVMAQLLLAIGLLRKGRNSAESRRPGWAWMLHPLSVLAFCLLYAWMGLTAQQLWERSRLQQASPSALQVEVVGMQFAWYFRYPGHDGRFGKTRAVLSDPAAGNPLGIVARDVAGRDDIVSGMLVLPAGREVDLHLHSLDVIHGFFVPGMRIKLNAVPGQRLDLHFTPVKTGDYPILCSQVCGIGHQRMQAMLRVVTPEQFHQWLAARETQKAEVAQ